MTVVLDVESIKKSYVQGEVTLEILKGVDFKAYKGETISIVGKSGSGKSTLLSMLAGLDYPDQGEIYLNGQSITKMDEAKLAKFRGRTMGIVFQQFHLMPHLTALENVKLPLEILREDDVEQRARLALQQVGLSDRLDHFSHQLSGGECQRVAIARAFVTEPSLLLADEPSGNLDDVTGNSVMDMLFELSETKKMTTILVTHNTQLAERCQKSFQLQNGKLVS